MWHLDIIIDTGESVAPPSKCCSSVAYQASKIQAISKDSDAQAGLSLCISHMPHC